MDGIAKWLVDLSWPLVSRVLVALGVGTVTYGGASAALGTALDTAKAASQGIGGVAAQLIARAGFFDFFAITSGSVVAGLTWMTLKHFALQTGTASSS